MRINREEAARYGLSAKDIAKFVEINLNGREISRVYEENYSFPIYLWTQEAARNMPGEVEELLLDTPAGAKIPLSQVASIEEVRAPNMVKHEGLSKRLAVSCNVQKRDLAGFVDELKREVNEKIKLQSGCYITFGGEYEAQSRAAKQMILLTLLVILGMFAVLIYAFRSIPKAVLIMLNLPLARFPGSGREIEHPLAIVIFGGMFTSTLLTLLIIPIGYLYLSKSNPENALG